MKAAAAAGVTCMVTIGAHAQFDPAVIGQLVHHWEFEEAVNTPLTGAADSVGTSSWIYDLGYNVGTDTQTSWTTGTGAFNVRRPGAGHYINSFAPNNASGAGSLFLVADVSWDYTDSGSPADFRIGFHNATAGEDTTSPTAGTPPVTIFAEMVIRRLDDDVRIGAWGTNETGGIIISPNDPTAPWTNLSGRVQEDPVRVVLEMNLDDRWGAVHFSFDGINYTTVGGTNHTFDLNQTWDPNFVRFGALNNFVSGDGEGFFIHDLYVAIPEPSTYALLFGLGVLGIAFLRRSRQSRQG